MKLTKSKLKQLIKEELSQLLESDRYPSDDEPVDWLEDRRFEPDMPNNMPSDPLDIQTIADDLAVADEAWNRMFLVAEKAGVDVSALKAAYRALPMAGTILKIELAIKANQTTN